MLLELMAHVGKAMRAAQQALTEAREARALAREPGPKGEAGADGRDGAPGPQGPVGEAGRDGAVGPQGAMGERGEQGLPGATGEPGPAGADGVPGPVGADGRDGVPGKNGADGAHVARAEIVDGKLVLHLTDGAAVHAGAVLGERGEAGDRGQDGRDGRDGRDGIGIRSAEVDEAGMLTLSMSDGSINRVGLVVGPPGPRGEAGSPGERGEIGPQGATGPAGDAGPRGEHGERGERGAAGLRGDRGEAGAPGRDGMNAAPVALGERVKLGVTASDLARASVVELHLDGRSIRLLALED